MNASMRAAFTLGLLLSPCAFALNPALDINQYEHHAWKITDGISKGAIYSIAQTPDGYLWLGTEFGLRRFDGVRSAEWTPPGGEPLPSDSIRKLLVTRDGTLWIGTFKGLASWKDGRLTQYPQLSGRIVGGLFEDHEGVVWASGRMPGAGRLCAIQKQGVRCQEQDSRFGEGLTSVYECKGDLWAGGAAGLWRWKPDPPKPYVVPGPDPWVLDLIEGDNGALWMATSSGISQLVDGRVEPLPLPTDGPFHPYRFLRDREGGLWIATSGQGLWHLHQGKIDSFTPAEGFSDDIVLSLFEDREGSIWAGTVDGLNRFREFAVPTISQKQGMSGAVVVSVLAARDGSIWLGTSDGLDRLQEGRITIYRRRNAGAPTAPARQPAVRVIYDEGLPDNSVQSLFQDSRRRIWVATLRGIAYLEDGRFVPAGALSSAIVAAIAEEDAGNLWFSDLKLGIYHFLDGKLLDPVPWTKLGHKDEATAMIYDPARGGLWLGFRQGGVAFFKEGNEGASYAAGDGLGEGGVSDLRLDHGGVLWAATEGGLSRLKDGRAATLTRKIGLPCDRAHWSIEDDAQSVWVNMSCGLVKIAHQELDAWAADPSRTVKATVYDTSDGVRSYSTAVGYFPQVTKATDGKLWFGVVRGASVVDPRQIPFNKLPPPVHIEKITADRKTYDIARNASLRMPPLLHDLEIDYTALSFVAPEKNRFRYKLEGYDQDWQEAGNRREAFYTNLSPRKYIFRVMGSNNDGVWNEAGDAFAFSVAPAYYQTTLFRALCVAAFLGLLWALHLYRLHQIAREFHLRLEGRVNERTRIARELHDTLLQSFQGVLMKFSTVKYVMRSRPDEAEQMLESTLEQARGAIAEGRDAVQGLRSSTVVANDLAHAITLFGEGQAANQPEQQCPAFRVEVEGESRDLPPLVRDEVYRIALEAVRNAFCHAHARRIDVVICYDSRQLRVRVCDDGKGIDPAVLKAGSRDGHHGLPGIKERAELAGGKLAVSSKLNSGTEIELTIPAAIAYRKSPPASSSTTAGEGEG
jgi:signal transduction histidine kinase/ligand-binding sensor domain-containing protein